MNHRGIFVSFLIAGMILLGLSFSSVFAGFTSEGLDEETNNLSEGPWPSFGRDEKNTRLSAFDAGHVDGTVNWTYNTNSWIWSSPAIGSEGIMYFGSHDDHLYAVDVEDGNEKWTFAADGEILSSPAVSEEEIIYFGSGDNNIYALESDGSLRWIYETGGDIHSSPTVDEEGNVYVGSYDGYLYSLDRDGELNWRFNSDSWLWSSPSIYEDTVYVGSGDHSLYAIDINDGEEIWNYSTEGQIYSSPAVDDENIYFGSYDDHLYALDKDGNLRWSFAAGDNIHSSPAIGEDGTIYFGSEDERVYAVQDGEEVWSFDTDDRVRASPALSADGYVFIGSYDEKFYSLDSSGEVVWTFEAGDRIYSSAAIGDDGRIFVGSNAGSMLAFGGSHGDPDIEIDIWREVEMTVRIAGRPSNSITALVYENGDLIESLQLIREPGPPQEETFEVRYNTDSEYTLVLEYEAEHKGANPVWTEFTAGDWNRTLFDNFKHNCEDEVAYDLDEEIGEMVSEVKDIHFSAAGEFDEEQVSSYEWDFGDGNSSEGRNASHEYSSYGTYEITLNVTFVDGDVRHYESIVVIGEDSSGDGECPSEPDPPEDDVSRSRYKQTIRNLYRKITRGRNGRVTGLHRIN